MASNIVPTNIDNTFPVAGQDNSSQGFRDNFTNIKNNFTFARNEISDLQGKVILTAALDGITSTIINDMAGTQLIRPQLKQWTQALADLGAIEGAASISFEVGNFQKLTSAGPMSISLDAWPSSVGSGALGYGAVRLWIVLTDTAHTVTLPESITIGVIDITGFDPVTRAITFDRTGNYIFDFSSVDGGDNFFISDPMRNRSTIRDDTVVTGALEISGNVGINSNLTVVNSVTSTRSSVVITGDTNGNVLLPQNNGVMLHITGQAGSPSRFYIDGQGTGNYSAIVGRQYRGTVAAPTGLSTNDIITRFGATPRHSTGWPTITTSRIDMVADETQTATALGSRLEFYVTPKGTATVAKRMHIDTDGVHSNGNLFVANTFVPTSSTSGGAAGQISFDSGNVYICLGPNNWKKATLTSF